MQLNQIQSQHNFKGKSFLMIKPHAIKENKTPQIISYLFENTKGLKIVNAKETTLTRAQAEAHYAEHKGKEHFERIVNALLEGPVLMMKVKGPKIIEQTQAIKKDLRLKFGDPQNSVYNALHMSDSKKATKRELQLHLPSEPSLLDKLLNKLNFFKK
jgi:nucleoside-diphosphate kinase